MDKTDPNWTDTKWPLNRKSQMKTDIEQITERRAFWQGVWQGVLVGIWAVAAVIILWKIL
jgi:hypothetical protein